MSLHLNCSSKLCQPLMAGTSQYEHAMVVRQQASGNTPSQYFAGELSCPTDVLRECVKVISFSRLLGVSLCGHILTSRMVCKAEEHHLLGE